MANVHLAEDEELGRRVAIKIINERYANDDVFMERFRREAKAAESLSHWNIVSLFDVDEADGIPYIAMEVIEGRSLKELLTTRGPLPIPEALGYAHQILEALGVAHQHGVIHRDIKPENSLIGEQGLKVTDFGIGYDPYMSDPGSIMHTAQYLSPEQARGVPVTASSDLYSVGIVLYEMLTGRVPFTGDSAIEIAMKHLNDMPKPPSKIRPEIPEEIDRIVLRALAKAPEDRYESAEQFDQDLQRVEGGSSTFQSEEAVDVATCSAGGITVICECGCGVICTEPAEPGGQPDCFTWCEPCPDPKKIGVGQTKLPEQPVIAWIRRRDSGRRPTLDADVPVEIKVNGVSVAGLAQVLDALLADEVCLPLRRGQKRLRASRRKTTIRDFARSVGLGLEPARSTTKKR